MVVKLLPHLVGMVALFGVVAGVWGLFGWQVGYRLRSFRGVLAVRRGQGRDR